MRTAGPVQSHLKFMNSYREGVCQTCFGPIRKGEEIVWNMQDRTAHHARCHNFAWPVPGSLVRVTEERYVREGEGWRPVNPVELGTGAFPGVMRHFGNRAARRIDEGFEMTWELENMPAGCIAMFGGERRGGSHYSRILVWSAPAIPQPLEERDLPEEARGVGCVGPDYANVEKKLAEEAGISPDTVVGMYTGPEDDYVSDDAESDPDNACAVEDVLNSHPVEDDLLDTLLEEADINRDVFDTGDCAEGCRADHKHGHGRGEGLTDEERERIAKAAMAGHTRQARKAGFKPVRGVVPAKVARSGEKSSSSQEEASAPVPAPAKPVRPLMPGTFTVVFPSGKYRTVDVQKNDNPTFFEGQGFVIGYLRGADNESDFESCGIVKDDGSLIIWRKFRGGEFEQEIRDCVKVLTTEDAAEMGQTYAMQSGRCWRCRRKLTVPASLHRGLGPDCAEKVGF